MQRLAAAVFAILSLCDLPVPIPEDVHALVDAADGVLRRAILLAALTGARDVGSVCQPGVAARPGSCWCPSEVTCEVILPAWLLEHVIENEEALRVYAGPAHLIVCSCGEQIQEGPNADLTPYDAKVLAHEAWKLHVHGA